MMREFTRLAAVSLIAFPILCTSAKAGEPQAGAAAAEPEMVAGTLVIPEDSSKAVSRDVIGGQFSRASFTNATPAVRVAMCGVEADAGNTNLDAGLIDFNVPDPARAAGRASDDQRDVGRNVGDYRSSVVLGVTLGYHF
jgi:hypothetical protein